MVIYEVFLTDGSEYEPYETSAGLFDSEDKAEEAKKKIEELVEMREETHTYVCIVEHHCLNELDKEVLKHWNLLD